MVTELEDLRDKKRFREVSQSLTLIGRFIRDGEVKEVNDRRAFRSYGQVYGRGANVLRSLMGDDHELETPSKER